MNIPDTLTAWAALGVAALAPVGALFGAVAGAVAHVSGHAPGGALGKRVVRLIERGSATTLSPAVTGAITGAVDGAFFLGLVGIGVGLTAGYGIAPPNVQLLFHVTAAVGVLALAALALGFLARALVRGGMHGLVLFFAVTAGGLVGLCLNGANGALGGLLLGVVFGLVGMSLHGRDPGPGGPNEDPASPPSA
jgi:hypothetical protein